MRSPVISRLYLQVGVEERIDDWPDDRIWAELRTRLATDDGWELADGPVLEKGLTAMRSFVAEPMRHGRLFLAGDAAHIVPATGAKGLNLAVADVTVLAAALETWYATGDTSGLDTYSDTCLGRVWQAQYFSWWMTSMLHKLGDDPYQERLQLAQLNYLVTSPAAGRSLAENYVGLATLPT
jgi:p-hydroxybenzoate 3-monooxygenase